MDFITYPVNTRNPGSIIPILFGVQWSTQLPQNSFNVYLDKISRDRGYYFDLEKWLANKGFDPSKILRERSPRLSLLFFNNFRAGISVKVCEDFWYKCQCGKVEFLDQAILAKSYQKHLKLIDEQNKCILCNSKVILCRNRGLVAVISPDKSLCIGDLLKGEEIYPTNVYREIRYWIDFFSKQNILLSRVRETPYKVKYQNENFYLDPTLFNIFATFLERDSAYVITGREAVIAYALGILFFGKGLNHIFLPRFVINNWNELIDINLDELTLLFIGNMNWNKNKTELNLSDLKFIKKHRSELNKKLTKTQVSNTNDLTLFNRNFYSL